VGHEICKELEVLQLWKAYGEEGEPPSTAIETQYLEAPIPRA
jgi:hypothetical protein